MSRIVDRYHRDRRKRDGNCLKKEEKLPTGRNKSALFFCWRVWYNSAKRYCTCTWGRE